MLALAIPNFAYGACKSARGQVTEVEGQAAVLPYHLVARGLAARCSTVRRWPPISRCAPAGHCYAVWVGHVSRCCPAIKTTLHRDQTCAVNVDGLGSTFDQSLLE